MVTPTCRKCRRVIPREDVNVVQDVAYCRVCNLSYALSALTRDAPADEGIDLGKPPPGAGRRNEGRSTVITATHRSMAGALGALAFALFWNGIVSVFVLLAVAGTLRNLEVAIPEWFPAPVMNDRPLSVGMTIFLWVFLTPFIAVGCAAIAAFLSCLAGRTEVKIAGSQGTVFAGIGPLGWCRRFDPGEVRDVRLEDRQWRDSDGDRQRKAQIVLETRAGKPIRFGSVLSEERRRFVAAATRRAVIR